jgi:hypothetical protein
VGFQAGNSFAALSRGRPGTSIAAGLAKGDGEQARTQQHKTCRCQGEESVRNEVMITHGAPADHDAGPDLLKISESAFVGKSTACRGQSGPRTKPVIGMGQKNAGADQAHKCCHCLNHRIVHRAPARGQNDCRTAQSKEFPQPIEDRARLMISRNRFVGRTVAAGE